MSEKNGSEVSLSKLKEEIEKVLYAVHLSEEQKIALFRKALEIVDLKKEEVRK